MHDAAGDDAVSDKPQYRAEDSAWREDIETAIEDAKSAAAGRAASVSVIRKSDSEVLALAWPDGRVDLTFAGSSVA